jgi:hypothetical protein
MSCRKSLQSSPENWLKRQLAMTHARNRRRWRCEIACDWDYLIGLYHKQNGNCAITNMPMTTQLNDLRSISIDRIDSALGYIRGNIQLVCQWANFAKNKYSTDELRLELREFLNPSNDCLCDHSLLHNWLSSSFHRIQTNKKAEYGITIDDLLKLYQRQSGRCAITDVLMKYCRNNLRTASVDRIDPQFGYYINNIHLVCRWANFAKGRYSLSAFTGILREYRAHSISNLRVESMFC